MKRNTPSPEGRAIGVHLADHADAAEVVWLAENRFAPQRCRSCAFRSGTYPNGCLSTLIIAVECALTNDPFMCHEYPGWRDGRESTKVCAGHVLVAGTGFPPAMLDEMQSVAGSLDRRIAAGQE